MSEAACLFCPVIEGLRHNETYQVPSGEVIQKIYELPTAIVVLSNDQYYPEAVSKLIWVRKIGHPDSV